MRYGEKALKPFGDEYAALLDRAFNERWIDVVENKGKRSGAYSMGTFGCHPYVLLNYQKSTHEVFTIAHELGHAMHTYFSCKAQPFAKSDYEIFVAEIASTVNEVLMLKYLLANTDNVDTKKFLLSYYLDMFRTTLFRQTMFAEFELKAHNLVEQNQPLSAEGLSDIYMDLNKNTTAKPSDTTTLSVTNGRVSRTSIRRFTFISTQRVSPPPFRLQIRY